eukprot:jgi/Pico_ML_1/50638/g167.t1
MGKKRTKKPSPGLMEEAAIQATKAAYKVLSGNLSATSKVMKRSWATVKSWVKDRKPKASPSKRRSLSYARGHGKWLCNLLKSRALEGQAMGTRDVMSEWEARRVEAMGPTTLEELKTCTFRAWKELSKEGLGSKLLKTMPKRLEEVILNRGEFTKY